jgi:hypothetical protein
LYRCIYSSYNWNCISAGYSEDSAYTSEVNFPNNCLISNAATTQYLHVAQAVPVNVDQHQVGSVQQPAATSPYNSGQYFDPGGGVGVAVATAVADGQQVVQAPQLQHNDPYNQQQVRRKEIS